MEYGFSLGSNLGRRRDHLSAARDALAGRFDHGTLECSPLYETDPVDVAEQHRDLAFLNAVVIARTDLEPRCVLDICREIEAELGRDRRAGPNSPRTIDVDIIYAGELVIDEPDLKLPHPRWSTRRFVLRPFADLRPDLRLPGATHSVSKLLDETVENGRVSLFESKW